MDFTWKSRKGKGKPPETLPGMIPARTKGRGARGVAAAPLGEEKMWDWLELKAQDASGVLEILREIPNPAFLAPSRWREMIIFGISNHGSPSRISLEGFPRLPGIPAGRRGLRKDGGCFPIIHVQTEQENGNKGRE